MFFINIVILVTHINILKLRCSHGMIHMSVPSTRYINSVANA